MSGGIRVRGHQNVTPARTWNARGVTKWVPEKVGGLVELWSAKPDLVSCGTSMM
jgi:hypothetical protein